MQFFTVPCPGKGKVSVGGSYQGENMDGAGLKVFQCNKGVHDIGLECLVGKQCLNPLQRVEIKGTNPIDPMEVKFTCAP
jgi:hypothetical protein